MWIIWNTLETLGDQLAQAKLDGTVTRTIAKICRADIIVIDDIGVLPVEPIQAEAFYRIIDTAYRANTTLYDAQVRPQDTNGPRRSACA